VATGAGFEAAKGSISFAATVVRRLQQNLDVGIAPRTVIKNLEVG
jgi:hypothetical protein